jgi:DNA-binding XRE family transcriptional regulator
MTRRDELIAARERAGLSRAALGALIGVNRTHIHHVEAGNRNPSIALMRRWAVALKAGSKIWTDEDAERVSLHIETRLAKRERAA